MMTKLIHWWRLLVEPSGEGKLFLFGPQRWYVQYPPSDQFPDGARSNPMAYDVAFEYAGMFGGTVHRMPK